jgi:outer membrane immunogenic protein
MKRKALTGLAALTLFDIATAQAQMPPAANWTGFYLGANGGYRSAHAKGDVPLGGFIIDELGPFAVDDGFLTVNTVAPFSFRSGGGIGGIHGGYNFQINRNWVVGWEADANWGRTSQTFAVHLGSIVPGAFGTFTYSASADWSTSLRGRVAYATGPWLLFGTAGLSVTRMSVTGSGGVSYSDECGCDSFSTIQSTLALSGSKLLFGPVVGAGVEYLLANRWTVRAEYLFASYGSAGLGNGVITNVIVSESCAGCVTGSSGPTSASLTTQTLRLGLTARLP